MTNEEDIKSKNTRELADYINSVFYAGVLSGKLPVDSTVCKIDYYKWLKEEKID